MLCFQGNCTNQIAAITMPYLWIKESAVWLCELPKVTQYLLELRIKGICITPETEFFTSGL